MEDLKQEINKVLRKKGILDLAQSAWVVVKANELGRGEYQAIAFKNGELTIKAKNQSAQATLQLESQKIIEKINQELGQLLIKRLRFN